MKINIEATPHEIAELLQAIESSKEQKNMEVSSKISQDSDGFSDKGVPIADPTCRKSFY